MFNIYIHHMFNIYIYVSAALSINIVNACFDHRYSTAVLQIET